MKPVSRRALMASAAVAFTGLSLGCGGANPFMMLQIINGERESRVPAAYSFKVPKGAKEARVFVICSSSSGLSIDLVGVDRALNSELITSLDARLQENEEKVLVKKVSLVDEFKRKNPNWKRMDMLEVGRELGADYVLDVEIEEMDIYKPGSNRQWLSGRATVNVHAFDLSKTNKEPAFTHTMTVTYPMTGEVPVESQAQVSQFRQSFVKRIAADISIKFTSSVADRRSRFSDQPIQ